MSTGAGPAADACPIEVAFDGEGIPEKCLTSGNTVAFSPADHHADPLSVERAIRLCRECSETVQGSGLYTAADVVRSVSQLQSEYDDDVDAAVYAQITTRDHERYPRTVVFGFSVTAKWPFRFPDVVQRQVGGTFEEADALRLTDQQLSVVTDDHPLPGGATKRLLDRV